MRPAVSALAFTLTGFFIGAVFFIAASLVLAWTGPTQPPPNGNIAAPINVGTTDQVKNAGLALNALAVFGNSILSGPSVTYLNFGATSGLSGYGIRDNAGTMEFKNNAGSWSNLTNSVLNVLGTGAVTQIKFSDGTTQTTAAVAGGITDQTYVTCTASSNGASCTTAGCPTGYVRTGCSAWNSDGDGNAAHAQPSGTNQCRCRNEGNSSATCYTYCAKQPAPLIPTYAFGGQTSTPITAQTVYTLSCIDLSGTTQTKTATVTIIPTFQEL